MYQFDDRCPPSLQELVFIAYAFAAEQTMLTKALGDADDYSAEIDTALI
jgi:hypothetical protein